MRYPYVTLRWFPSYSLIYTRKMSSSIVKDNQHKQTKNKHQQYRLQIHFGKQKNTNKESVCQSIHLSTDVQNKFLQKKWHALLRQQRNLLAYTRNHHEKFPYSMMILCMWPGLKSRGVCQPISLDRRSLLCVQTPALKQRRRIANPMWLFREKLTKYLINTVSILLQIHFMFVTAAA